MTDRARMETGWGQGAAARDGEPPALEQAFDGDSLFALRATVAAHGSRAGLSEGRTRDLVLAVHELAANAVRHGAGQGRLRLWIAPDRVRCEVADDGADGESPGAEAADAALWHVEPGHGLWLVRRIADGASVQSDPSGTVAAVSFRLGTPGPPAPFRLDRRAEGGCTILAVTGQLDLGSSGEFGGAVGDLTMSAILRVTLSSSGRFERARLHPVLLAGTGRPVPGGGAVSFVARLSAADFGASAARISPSGVITRAK